MRALALVRVVARVVLVEFVAPVALAFAVLYTVATLFALAAR